LACSALKASTLKSLITRTNPKVIALNQKENKKAKKKHSKTVQEKKNEKNVHIGLS
jgi:hypothetical protein